MQLDTLMDQGVSLSGHERNCAFLNVPLPGSETRRFVTASAALGLDFDDDARATAAVDWDRDGDLDFWITNRTAPMLRLVRNQLQEQAASTWVAFRLQGKQSNRDGIGARVVVTLAEGRSLTKTLKAGDGFLSQSSKWLHFGLGSTAGIARIEVHWPGGARERFTEAPLSGRYRLVQGTGRAQPVTGPKTIALAASEAPSAETVSGTAHAVTPSRWPLPRLPYTTWDGRPAYAGGASDKHTLVNLWATWCVPCVAELKAFSQNAKALEKANIDVVALSVDGLQVGDATAASDADPAAYFRRLKLPFTGGRATAETVRRLEVLYARLFGPQWALPVPTSVLLDQQGAVLAFYKGAVPIERILTDARQAAGAWEAWHDASLPFPGQWYVRPQPLDPILLGLDLMDHGQVEDAAELAQRGKATFQARSSEYGKLLTWIGDGFIAKKRPKEGMAHYRAALAEDDKNVLVLNNLAWQLATHPDKTIRNGTEAVRWAERATHLTAQNDPGVLDTLAAAYAEAGAFEKAVAATQRGIALARQQGNQALRQSLQMALKKYQAGQPYAQ